MSVYLSLCLSIGLSLLLYISLTISLSVYLSRYVFHYLFIPLSISLAIFLFMTKSLNILCVWVEGSMRGGLTLQAVLVVQVEVLVGVPADHRVGGVEVDPDGRLILLVFPP